MNERSTAGIDGKGSRYVQKMYRNTGDVIGKTPDNFKIGIPPMPKVKASKMKLENELETETKKAPRLKAEKETDLD